MSRYKMTQSEKNIDNQADELSRSIESMCEVGNCNDCPEKHCPVKKYMSLVRKDQQCTPALFWILGQREASLKIKTRLYKNKSWEVVGKLLKQEYKGCGKVWVGVTSNGQVVGIRYMGDHPCFSGSSPAALKRASRSRNCLSSRNAAEELTNAAFMAHRKASRTELQNLVGPDGEILSRMASGTELVPLQQEE